MKVLLATSTNPRPVLEDKGFTCVEASDDVVEDLRFGVFDMVVLDDTRGIPIVRAIRRAGLSTPIFMLTRGRAIATRVEALNLGADEVQQAPMDDEEFVARVLAVLRRDRSTGENEIRIGGLSLDVKAQCARVYGVFVHLTKIEYQMVELMARRVGSVITRSMLMDHIYGGIDEPESDRFFDVVACKIRKKLFVASGGRDWVETVWGRGFRLVPEDKCCSIENYKRVGYRRAG